MSPIQNLLLAALDIYTIIIVVRAVFSWLPPRHRASRLYLFIDNITEPVLRPIRRVLPRMGMIDLSPLVLLVGLMLVRRLVLSL